MLSLLLDISYPRAYKNMNIMVHKYLSEGKILTIEVFLI